MHHTPRLYEFALAFVLAATAVLGIDAKPLQDGTKSELQMTLSTTTMMLCLGSPLPLEVAITNLGSKQVKIDRVDLWANFEYSFSGANGGRGGGYASNCDSCRGDYVVVMPGANQYNEFAFPLSSDFFKDIGRYHIRLKYSDITTNQLDFELYDCNPK
jgi:hypothetical protein